MNGRRIAIFLTVVLSIWTLMHVYVFWRLYSIPWVTGSISLRSFVLLGLVLWLSYPVARTFEHHNWRSVALPLEWIGAIWMGFLFLLLALLLAVDIVTAGGWLMPKSVGTFRGVIAAAAAILSLLAVAQAARPPVIRDYEVALSGLPQERDGLTLLQLTDLHLGTLLSRRWLERLIHRVDALQPDLIVMVGDLIDGNVDHVQPLLPVLQKLRAPLGVWAVTGNHEFYAGEDRSVQLMKAAGYHVLRDESAPVISGLILAGVDDLTARRTEGSPRDLIRRALERRGPGGVILLSHTPWEPDAAAKAGAGLMLCGHTHHGQMWPFNFLVRLRYKHIGGRYQVEGMPLIISRGAGTWGPPMRLWHPSEIVRIRLRSA